MGREVEKLKYAVSFEVVYFTCVSILPDGLYVCITFVVGEDPRALGCRELTLQRVVSLLVGSGNQTQVLWNSSHLEHSAISPAPGNSLS